jgi:(p)ppGpp synthase/HD superfamily hydrolase
MKLAQAIHFADRAHLQQVRKFTNLPYITHPLAVGELVRSHGGTEAQVIAAILHDTVEDTEISIGDVLRAFGQPVARLVAAMTKPHPYDYDMDVHFWSLAPAEACLIRLADIVDNTNDVVDLNPHYAATYLPKKYGIVHAMIHTMRGHPLLHRALAQTR